MENVRQKEILILTQWYTPENVSGKINSIGEEFIKLGYKVTCFTGYPNYPAGKIFNGYKFKINFCETINGVNVRRFPSYIYHGKNKIKRFLTFATLSLSTLLMGIFFIHKKNFIFLYDSLLSMGIPAVMFSRLTNSKLLFEIQDMYPETLSATQMVTSEKILKKINYLNKYVCSKSDYISVISKGFKENLISKNINEKKIFVSPNWAENFITIKGKDLLLLKKYRLENKFNIIYAGNIGIAQELDNIIDTAEKLKLEKRINFVIIGDGNDKDRLESLAKKKELNNIIFISKVPMNEVSQYFALADILLIHLKDDKIFEITIPSKTIAYLAAGKPILAVAKGEVTNLIENANAGFYCEPNNSRKLAEVILKIASLDDHTLSLYGENGRKYFEKYFTKESIITNYKSILEEN